MSTSIVRPIVAALVLVSVLAQSGSAAGSIRFPASTAQADLTRQEEQLVHEIDRQADAIFAELQRQQPELPITLLKKTQREAVYRLRQMHVLSDVLKAAGPAPAIALVAGEVLSTFVFAPMFAAKGNVLMATVSMTVPWGIIAGGAAASYEMLKARLKLARELKSSLFALYQADKIRKAVIGYDVKNRVSTAMFEMMKDRFATEIEFEVVKKMKSADAARTSFVTVNELEALVKSIPEGATFLEHIYFERLDKGLYSALMLRFLSEDGALAQKLLDVLKARSPMSPTETVILRNHLLAVDDLKKSIARDLRTVQQETKALKAKTKAGSITQAQADRAKSYLKDEIKRLQSARADLTRHEYKLLLDVKAPFKQGEVTTVESIARQYAPTLVELQRSSRHVPLDVATLAPPSGRPAAITPGRLAPRQCLNVFAGAAAR